MKGKEKKKKIQNEDEVYDPYDLLVQVQNKNDIINKIESIPIVLDKNFLEMKKEEKKERPQTSKLRAKFQFDNKNYVPGKKSTAGLFFIDEETRMKRIKEEENRKKIMKIKEEEIKRKEDERNDVIKHGDNDKVEELLNKVDRELNEMEFNS